MSLINFIYFYEGIIELTKYAYVDLLRCMAILGVVGLHSSQGISGLDDIFLGGFNYLVRPLVELLLSWFQYALVILG